MKRMTEQDLEAWDKAVADQIKFLKSHGWVESKEHGHEYKWQSPDGQSILEFNHAYTRLITGLIKERGWRRVKEIRHLGRKEWNKVNEWARYQSPVTKRVYGYPDVEYFAENNWEEGELDKCSGSSQMLSKLVGVDFEEDTVETWLHRKDDGTEEYVLDFWTE